jgi:hypothetical protein
MNAYKVETILSEDGALTLKDLPFHVGDAVEVIILERSPSVSEEESPSQLKKAMDQSETNLYPLRGRLGCPIFAGKSSDLTEIFCIAR